VNISGSMSIQTRLNFKLGLELIGGEKCGGLEGVETIEDGTSYHTSTYTMKYRLLNGITQMD
jgi:hypothetical protein